MTATETALQRVIDTPLGHLRLLASARGLAGVWFVEGQRHAPDAQEVATWPQAYNHSVLNAAADQLIRYFEGRLTAFSLPLDLSSGTLFQREVWQALNEIPHGQTRSYRCLAERIGRPQAMRAVGAAVGRNPLSMVVPCHRVLGSDGSLTGYAGGLDRKQALLQLEHATI